MLDAAALEQGVAVQAPQGLQFLSASVLRPETGQVQTAAGTTVGMAADAYYRVEPNSTPNMHIYP